MQITKKLVILGTGGTIAGVAARSGDHVGYRAGQLGVEQLLQAAPALQTVARDCTVLAEQVFQCDSKDMELSQWLVLAQRVQHYLVQADVAAVMVTHGTDTLEETAYFLHCVLDTALLRQKPVVLTCAMRPATAAQPDGPGNLADAAVVALSGVAQGVLVVCAGKVHSAVHVQKVHPYRLDAFDSGEAGALGVVEEGRVRWWGSVLPAAPMSMSMPSLVSMPSAWDVATLSAPMFGRVEIVMSHAGASGALVRGLLHETVKDSSAPKLSGIVVAGTGNGTLHSALVQALHEAQQQGVCVWRVSRCAYGCVVQPPDSPEEFTSVPLSAVKARIAMLLHLLPKA